MLKSPSVGADYAVTADRRAAMLVQNSELRAWRRLRQNWLFAGTGKRAEANAARYGIVSTDRANGIEPREYLRRLFAELPKAKTGEFFDAMLPFNTAPI